MRIGLLIVLLAAGCATEYGSPGMGVSRQAMEDKYRVSLTVDPQWKLDCWGGTEKAIQANLVVPKSLEFTSEPEYEAYYDTARDVTALTIFGSITSRGKHSQIYNQSYYVIWERPGNAEKKPGDWQLTNIAMY